MATLTTAPAVQQREDIKVSLTSFADYLFKSGPPKLNCVSRIRQQYRSGYNPGLDYYKIFRDAIRGIHSTGLPLSELDTVVDGLSSDAKKINYQLLVKGYTRFWCRNFAEQAPRWFLPDRKDWAYGGVTIKVNPELGFVSENTGETYVIKMYNKKEPIKKRQLDILLHLMQLTLHEDPYASSMAVLDVRRGKLFEASSFNEPFTTLLEAEALAFERLWRG